MKNDLKYSFPVFKNSLMHILMSKYGECNILKICI